MNRLIRIPRGRASLSRRDVLKGGGALGIALLVDLPFAGCRRAADTADTAENGDSTRVYLDGATEVEVGSQGTWTVEVVAPEGGYAAGDGIAIAVEHGTDWGGGENDYGMFTERFGGVSVSCDDSAATFEHEILAVTSSYNALRVSVTEGSVAGGTTIRITLGDTGAGSAWQVPTIAHDASVRVLEHTGGEETEDGFSLYRELAAPVITVVPSATEAATVLARSHAVPGDAIPVLVRLEDSWGNVSGEAGGTVRVYDDATDTLLVERAFSAEDGGLLDLDGVVWEEQGLVRLRVEIPELDLVVYGGPVEVYDSPERPPVRWGEIHGHSLVSDGLGSAEDWYTYARDASRLDFAALTDHGYLTEQLVNHEFFRHYIDEETWGAYAEVCAAYHEPGAFVTFLAYEWTSNVYSDKIVYFLSDEQPWEAYPETLEDFYDQYAGREGVTVVSHMMWAASFMRATDWSTFDDDLERVVEVASVHGVREYAGGHFWPESDTWAAEHADSMSGHLVADGLEAGWKLGLACGSDTHTGFPGNAHPGRHPCRCAGMMAIRAGELTREALWERWQARAVYGTTGPRILLDFEVEGVEAGGVLEIRADAGREIRLEIASPRGVERVEIIRGDPAEPLHTESFEDRPWNPDPIVITDDDPLEKATFYYARITLEGEHYAWSSPVFVDPVDGG